MDIFDDLEAELDDFGAMLAALDAGQWLAPSSADGWTVADVVLHLAQTEEAVSETAALDGEPGWRDDAEHVDAMVETWVAGERQSPAEVHARWCTARFASVATLRAADPQRRLRWAAAPLKPATLATTRIAEHWAHALDIAVPLGIEHPDTDRLRHIAWLAHSTLPYAFGLHGIEPQPVRFDLVGPSGDEWTFGVPDAPTRISGSAAELCRIGAQRLDPADAHMIATGPLAVETLRVVRNYAF